VSSLAEAIAALESGRFVMVHDSSSRENEIDMVVAAERITPQHIATMRTEAGGLICLAVANEIAAKLGLPYMHDMMRSLGRENPAFLKLVEGRAAYGDMPSFSISLNHRETFTGITDWDRALTISKMAAVCRNIHSGGVQDFERNFRSPGHVPILIASKGLLSERLGHTELCIHLAKLANIVPAVAICEMMDSTTYRALSIDKALEYSRKAGIPMVEANQLKASSRTA
jgi:3,4-dihydroxy 2-butanone 4-phosphate synthase